MDAKKRIIDLTLGEFLDAIGERKPLSEDEFKQTLAAWWGWAKYSDSEYLINKLNKITPYEIKFRR